MPALAALLEQLQPLPALRRQRRGTVCEELHTKEWTVGEGEEQSSSDFFSSTCLDVGRAAEKVRTDGVEVAR